MPVGYMLEASRMMPSMLGMPRMSAGLAGSMHAMGGKSRMSC